jgi:hypothetical protein
VEGIGQGNSSERGIRVKRFDVLGIVCVVALGLVVLSFGVLNHRAGNAADDGFLSPEEVTGAFAADGLLLTRNKGVLPSAFGINGVLPDVYKIGKTGDNLFVYVFPSIEDRRDACGQSMEEYGAMFSRYSQARRFYEARNVVVVYIPEDAPWNGNDLAARRFKRIGDVVFARLNDGKTLVFAGTGTSWEAEVLYKYYEHFWKDSGGALRYEGWNSENPRLKYRGSDNEEIGLIKYKFETASGSCSGTRSITNRYDSVPLGSSESNGALTREDDVYYVTVEWNGKTESFELRLKNTGRAHPSVMN